MKLEDFKKKNEKDIFELQQREEVPLLFYKRLQKIPWIKHCFTTRGGGVSQGIFSSMNLSFTRGDEREAVEENFHRIAKAMGTEYGKFVFTDQTHTTNVRKVEAKDAGAGILRERGYHDVDGLITDVPGMVLSTFYADCVPLYFVDTEHHAIGLSHSGWRGTVGHMGRVTIEAMNREYGTKPEQLLCAIGPSICQDCYEVSEDVIEEFRRHFDRELWPELFYPKENGKYQLNLWKANEAVLTEAGILKEHIAVTNVCTHCNPEILFSHRTTGDKRGNLSAFLALKE